METMSGEQRKSGHPLVEGMFGLVEEVMTAAAKGALNAGARKVQNVLRSADEKLMLVRAATKPEKPKARRRDPEAVDAEFEEEPPRR